MYIKNIKLNVYDIPIIVSQIQVKTYFKSMHILTFHGKLNNKMNYNFAIILNIFLTTD